MMKFEQLPLALKIIELTCADRLPAKFFKHDGEEQVATVRLFYDRRKSCLKPECILLYHSLL